MATYYGDGPVPIEDFPGAEHVVELCEQLTGWDMYRRTAEAEGLAMLALKMKGSAEEAMAQSDPERAKVIKQALEEWDEPNFTLYLKRKMW